MPIKKKRVRLSVEEKIWILNHRKENPMISQNKIALDFSVKVSESLQKLCYEIDQMYSRVNFLGTHFLGTNGIFEKNLMLTF